MMFTWSGEFTPRSLCNWGGGDSSSGDGGGFTGDGGGDYSGATGGDSWTGSESGGGGYFGGDTGGGYTGATGGDSWTGSETGGGGYFGGDTGGGYYGGATGGDSWTGSESGGGYYSGDQGGYIGPGDYGGSMPGSEFGSWGGPTAGVDYSGASQFAAGQNPTVAAPSDWTSSNLGAPAWSDSFGMYGYGGPTGTGLGPGSGSAGTATVGLSGNTAGLTGPQGAQIGPSGAGFGSPGMPGWAGGPATVQQGEGLGPGGFGIAPAPSSPVADPSSRSDINPSQNFGPETTANSGFFGVGQAQAASRGTDADIIAMNQGQQQISDQANLNDAFNQAQAQAQNNPALAEALSQIAANMQAPSLAAPGQLGPGYMGFEGVTPGAQQGFTGVSNAQNSPSTFGTFTSGEQGRGAGLAPEGDRAAGLETLAAQMQAQQAQQAQQYAQSRADPQDLPHGQIGPQFDLANPNVTPGQQNFTAGKTGTVADDFNARSDVTTRASDLLTPAQTQQLMTDFGPNYGPQQAPSTTTRGSDPDVETISLSRGPTGEINQDVFSNLNPETRGVGREAAPLGLIDMITAPARGSPVGNPYQAGTTQYGTPQSSGRGSNQSSVFGPSPTGGRGETAGRPGLSITVGGRGSPGYYNTGGAGIAPGAKGAEYGGAYGINSPGRPGTAAFGGDFRQGGPAGAYFYDPATGQYYQR